MLGKKVFSLVFSAELNCLRPSFVPGLQPSSLKSLIFFFSEDLWEADRTEAQICTECASVFAERAFQKMFLDEAQKERLSVTVF